MTELEQIEEAIKEHKKVVGLQDALIALEKNKDFKTLITDMYLRDYVLQSVTFSASIAAADEKTKRHNDMIINGVGALQQFFGLIQAKGEASRESLAAAEEERALALTEDEEEDN